MPEPASAAGSRPASATLIGMALWVAATICETAMVGCVRIVSQDLHPLQVVFLRMFCGLVVLAPWLLRLGAAGLRTTVFRLHALRSGLQVMAMTMWFASVPLVILADIAALSFLAPLFATAGAMLLLGERVGWRRGLALLIGFSGVLVIVRPGSSFNIGWGLLILAAVFWASALLVIKRMASSETSPCMTAWATILITPVLLIPAVFVWRDPSWTQWALMLAAGLAGTTTHLLMGQSFRYAEASAVMPMDFARMLWITLLGYMLFDETPTWHVWVGGALIFAAATYVTLREARLARRR
ncbi:DMT family transporter [Vineibacter terrae]|uniref:DMT family transporter n=1 Tax=Vineibacter terrae TaxID=2586908 RepID=A0A5C8PD22_9HYPH|nr:DMT family transporter [Vineibacter terrae]TXL71651.1 DMT family transporter [Vineibacter terrae]